MTNNRRILVTAFLAGFTALAHGVGGTIEIHSALIDSPLPQALRFLLYACWHLVTVTLVFSTIGLFWTAYRNRAPESIALLIFTGCLWVAFGSVFVLIALYFLGGAGLAMLPQWALLLPIGGCILFNVHDDIRQRRKQVAPDVGGSAATTRATWHHKEQ